MPEEHSFEAEFGRVRVVVRQRPRSRTTDPVVEEIRVLTFLDRWTGGGYGGESTRASRIGTEIGRAIEGCEARGELAIVPRPPKPPPGSVAQLDPYVIAVVSASAGAATKEIVSLVVATIRAVLAKRRDTEGEDWREPAGFL